jgi:hypothetical protein
MSTAAILNYGLVLVLLVVLDLNPRTTGTWAWYLC